MGIAWATAACTVTAQRWGTAHAQVHSWELQLAARGGREGSRAAEAEDVHALLQGSREDQDPEGPPEGAVLTELGLGDPTVLTASPPLAGGGPGGPELRRSDSSRSTASRMSSKSPPRGRHVVTPTTPEACSIVCHSVRHHT